MQIASSTRQFKSQPTKPRVEAPKARSTEPKESFMRSSETADWLYAGASVIGGLATVAGGLSGQPLVTAGGAFVTAAATSLTIKRTSKMGMDQAGLASLVGGGTLLAAGTLLALQPAPASAPNGILPQLINKYGFHGL